MSAQDKVVEGRDTHMEKKKLNFKDFFGIFNGLNERMDPMFFFKKNPIFSPPCLLLNTLPVVYRVTENECNF